MLQPTAAVRSPAGSAVRSKAGVPTAFILLLAAWLFDFRSSGEGQAWQLQALFAAAYLFALTMLLIGDRAVGQRVYGLTALVGCGVLYIGVGVVSGILNDQQAYLILRNSMSVAIYLSTAYLTARVVLTSDPTKLRQILAIFCLLYAIAAYLIFNFIRGGIDLESVRFEVVGASAIAALGYAVLAALFKLSKLELAALALNGAVILVSITRTFLLVLGAQASIFIGQVRRVFSPRLIALGLLGGVGLLGVLAFGEQQLERWSERMLGGGRADYAEYQTFYTRLSEWEFMANSWTQSLQNFLFGSGIASKTTYYLPRELGGGTEFMIGFGHNQHLSMLFTAGIVGGLPLLLLQWSQAFLGWRFLRRTILLPHLRNDAIFLGAWGATIIIGHNVLNIVSATFVTRGSSLWFGIGTGLLLGAQALFDPANAPRKAPPPPPSASRYLPA
jgi:hypothetical protein